MAQALTAATFPAAASPSAACLGAAPPGGLAAAAPRGAVEAADSVGGTHAHLRRPSCAVD
jgi:hypothetical protein